MHRSFLLALLCLWTFASQAADNAPQDHTPAWDLIRERCLDCHGPDDQNGGLRFDRPSSSWAETDSGKPAVTPGDPDQSELIVRVLSGDEDLRMPPDGEPLSQAEVDALRRWIKAGAESPGSPAVEAEAVVDHWAFQPIQSVEAPSVRDQDWPRGMIDQFIQAKRESAGLKVAGDAEPVALIRRATFGLTGLPPTVDEIDRFVSRVAEVGSERAMEEMVDDLLSRPSYGERWGRHWMDWVRYADTAGDNSDYPIPQAFLYRNYIIDSLNRDLPYDRFVTEQIAGDLLPADDLQQRNRQRIATGYLAMARRFGSLVERYPWHLTIEDTIDNVGRTMLGMTISCARCHDHKFDPVSTRDYYGLYGIFASTRYPFPGLELFKAQRDFVSLLDENVTRDRLAKHQGKTDKLVAALDDHLARCEHKARENAVREKDCSVSEQRQMRDELDAMLIKARRAGEQLAAHLRDLPEMPTAYAVSEDRPVNASIQLKGEPTRPGATVERGFPKILGGWKLDSDLASQTSGRLQLAQWIVHPENPLTARVIVNRVWQRHFGTGIVASTSDFGERGELPSHPELLDRLAEDFVRNGWSLKRLHRQIMTSHTYALSSQGDPHGMTVDPNNRLHWRFNRTRLDAESIRDAILAVAGSLDGVPQTQPYPFPDRKDWTFTQHHPFKADYPTDKRSVYQMTKRLTVQPYLQTFDGPDPNVCTSSRDQSVTALQALYFVNDSFLHRQSESFADRLIAVAGDDRDRIRLAVRSILGREPDEAELQTLYDHLVEVQRRLDGSAGEPRRGAWASLVRSLFRLNEFLYLD